MKLVESIAHLNQKLKATYQEKRLEKWKEHFKNLLGNPPEVTEKKTKEIIHDQADELDSSESN